MLIARAGISFIIHNVIILLRSIAHRTGAKVHLSEVLFIVIITICF